MKNEHKLNCKQKWPIGAKFWYQSKYTSKPIEGIIDEVSYFADEIEISSITSTNGVHYAMREITIESELVYIRDEKLTKLLS